MKIIFIISNLLLVFFYISCDTIPINYSKTQSWYLPENAKPGIKTRGTIILKGVSVDRSGGWDSLEKEIAALAPVYFWKKGCPLAGSGINADYVAHISLREREFAAGWKTRRSLSMEIRVWKNKGLSMDDLAKELPVAAGRVVKIGNSSFSSSKVTGEMLLSAIKKTTKRLPVTKVQQQGA